LRQFEHFLGPIVTYGIEQSKVKEERVGNQRVSTVFP